MWIRNDLFRIRNQLRIFRVPDPDLDADPTHTGYYLSKLGIYFKEHIKLNQKEEFTNYSICHFLFHTTVLQKTQSRIHRLKN